MAGYTLQSQGSTSTPPQSSYQGPYSPQAYASGNPTTYQGMIPSKVTSPSGSTYHAPSSNTGVMDLQKRLNALGAGLIEDGISGPKTQAAMTKYSSQLYPTSGGSTAGSSTPTYPGMINGAPQAGTTTGSQIQNVSDAGAQTQNEYDTQARVRELSNAPSKEYLDAMAEAKRIQDQSGQYAQDYAQKSNNIAGTAGFLTQQSGLQGQLNNQYNTVQGNLSNQYAAATNRLGAANTQQGLQQGAAGTAYAGAQSQAGRAAGQQNTVLGAVQSQFPSYSSAQYNPGTGTYGTVGGGQYGSGPGAASNVSSVQDAQSKINNIDQSSQAINNNFTRAINYATSAGLTGNSPILSGFQRLYGQNFQTNPAVIGFTQSVGALNTQLQQFGETPIDLNNATQQTLTQAQETVKKDLLTQKSNYQSFIGNFNGSSGSSSSGGSSGGGYSGYTNGGAF